MLCYQNSSKNSIINIFFKKYILVYLGKFNLKTIKDIIVFFMGGKVVQLKILNINHSTSEFKIARHILHQRYSSVSGLDNSVDC